MTRLQIPSQDIKRWSGIFPGEFFGNLWLTRCIDLERNKGQISLGETLSVLVDSSDDADLVTPVKFVRTAADNTDRWWVVAGKLFKTTNTAPETGWTQDAIASSPTAPLWDAIEFGDSLYVAGATDISKLTAGTWTAAFWSGQTGELALTTGIPHRFAVLAGAMLITNGRYVMVYDGTLFTLDATKTPGITLPSDFEGQFILTNADYAFICCNNTTGGEAEVFTWNRSSEVYNSRYAVGYSSILAGFVIKGVPYIITKRGEIKRFSGQGFDTVQQFPSMELGGVINNINPNGVAVDGNIVKILVDFGTNADLRTLSGIWTYNVETNNLYHSEGIKNDVGKDWNQAEVSEVGAMALTTPTQGRYLVGAKAHVAYGSTTKYAIYSYDESSSASRGYIITPKIPCADIQSFWKAILPKFRNFKNSTDRIRIAYRIKESTTLPTWSTITWVNATSFTTTDANVAIGDFVEIIAGDGAGGIAKITNKTGTTTYTCTIEDVGFTAATSAARARFLNFIDLGTLSTQGIQSAIYRIAKKNPFIQFLIELRGNMVSPTLESFILEQVDKKI